MDECELAEIPLSWCWATIDQLIGPNGLFKDGDWVESKDQDPSGSVRLIQLADVGDGEFRDKSARFLTREKASQLNCTFVAPGDLLVARMPDPLGRACLFPLSGSAKFVTVVDVCIVRFGRCDIDAKYFMYVLNSPQSRKVISGHQTGSTRKRISRGNLSTVSFPIAPIKEQRRIVAKIEELFSELDNGIESLKTAQAQLMVYRQALLKHAFEGKFTAQWRADNPDKLETADALLERIQRECAQRYQQQLAEWEAGGKQGSKPKAPKLLPPLTAHEVAELPELPTGWIWLKLGSANVDVFDGPFGSNLKSSDYVDSGVRVIRLENIGALRFIADKTSYITQEKYALLQDHTVTSGDIVFSSFITESVRVTLLPQSIDKAVNKADCFCVRLHGETPSNAFVVMFLSTRHVFKQLEEKVHGVGRPRINTTQLKDIAIPICGLAEQKAITELIECRLSEADQLEQTLTASLEQAEALRQSILKKALSGRLVPQDVSDEPASMLLARIKAEKAEHLERAKPRKQQTVPVPSVPDKGKVLIFPARIAGIAATDLNAGILAMAYHLHEQNPKYAAYFHHVKAEKISHLIESHLGIDLERIPFKDAAGPNDYPHLKKVESRARKANWFDVRQQKAGGAYVFSRKPGFDGLLNKTANALGGRLPEVDALLQVLLPLNTRQAEIVATLYAAWNNLLLTGKAAADEDIVHEARENWHEAKLDIEREKFFRGLEWMRKKGLAPVGRGRYVAEKDKPSKAGRVKP